MDTFRAGGNGGQNQNKRDTGVRWTHLASGAVGESREFRTQPENKRAAWKRMALTKEFQNWHKRETARRLGVEAAIKTEVARQMQPKNIRVEVHDEKGLWVETTDGLNDMDA